MRTLALGLIGVAMLAVVGPSDSADSASRQHRLVGPSPATTSAVASSPVYQVYVVGGAGQPVGISASTNVSIVTGGTSNQLPTDRIFLDGLEAAVD